MIDLQRWYASSRQLHVGGQRIAVREDGDGPDTLLLIHGFPTSSWDWHLLWPNLRQRYRLIAPDLLGFGRSAKPSRHDYRIGEQADLCAAVLAEAGVGRCHVLAHDYGDTVAQELLARANAGRLPCALESVVLLNGGLFPECHRPVLLQRLLRGRLGPLLVRLTSKRRFAANLRRIFGPDTPPDAEHIDGFWALLQHDDGLRRMPALLHYIDERARQRERWVGALVDTRVPIGFINGNVDPISGAHMAARWRELLPQQPVIDLPRIGHYPQIEDPAAVLAAFDALHTRFRQHPTGSAA
jgi:pimeloyl-ACP methyl ester carboxylesterase